MRIVCWQMILIKYHSLFLLKIGKDVTNLLSAAVVIGNLKVKFLTRYLLIQCSPFIMQYLGYI